MSQNDQLGVSVASGTTAMVTVEHTARKMKFYNVAENELDTLSMLNTLRSGFASAGALCFGVALPDAFSALFPSTSVAVTPDMRKIVSFAVAAALFFAVSLWPRNRAAKIWRKIGSETVQSQRS
jgi:hypothetical protein